MTTRQKAKYLLLTILFLLAFLPLLHSGDFCSDFADVLQFVFVVLAYLLVLFVIGARALYRLWKHKTRLDFIPLLLTLIFCGLIALAIKHENGVFFEYETYSGRLETFDTCAQLSLYDDNTFIISTTDLGSTCYTKGSYRIQDNVLNLMRPGLSELTDGLFTHTYTLDTLDNSWVPSRKEFLRVRTEADAFFELH